MYKIYSYFSVSFITISVIVFTSCQSTSPYVKQKNINQTNPSSSSADAAINQEDNLYKNIDISTQRATYQYFGSVELNTKISPSNLSDALKRSIEYIATLSSDWTCEISPIRITKNNEVLYYYYYFFKEYGYGYVDLNSFFVYNNVSLPPLGQHVFITSLLDNHIIYSPVYQTKTKNYFYCHPHASLLCLWEKQQDKIVQIGNLTSQKLGSFKFEAFQYDNVIHKLSPTNLKLLTAIRALSEKDHNEQKKSIEELCAANSIDCQISIKTLINLYNQQLIPPKEKKGVNRFPLSILNSHWMIKPQNGCMQLFSNQSSVSYIITPPQTKTISNETIRINHFGKTATF